MVAGDGRGRDAGQSLGARQDRGDERVLLAEIGPRGEVGRVARTRQLVFGLQHTAGAEARVDAEKVPETANQQTRAGEQHDGERELAGDEHRPERRAGGADGAAPAVGLQRGLEVDAACVQRWDEAEQEAGGQRHRKGDCQDPHIDRRAGQAGNVRGRAGHQHTHAGNSEPDAYRRPDRRQHQPFRHELTGHSRRRRAERTAHRDLLNAAGAARDQQAGDIHAGGQRTSATAPSSTYNVGRTRPSTTSASGSTLTPRPRFIG